MIVFSAQDQQMMARALTLAAKGRFTASPNPAVGCVISVQNRILGEGYTRPAGGNHAEIEALNMAVEASGACVYVTLEPCSHYGKTGPCVEALINAGVARVVIASEDPNPLVSGRGIEKLKKAGVVVDCGLLEDQARQLNKGFFKRHEQGLPWILVKMASSIDGRTAMESGQSQWVTTPASRRDVQRLRAASCAIVTGIGTQLMDDPSLTVRITAEELGVQDTLTQPLRVVVDSQLQMQPTARMLAQPGITVIATIDGDAQRQAAKALIEVGAEVVFLPAAGEHIDLHKLVVYLAERECNCIMVEAGAGLAGAFIGEGLLDELVCYWAPKLFGNQARPMFNLPISTIDAHLALSIQDVRQIGEDLRITMYPDKDY
ncbi:MAG: bifunctional diaminohydroxyphosphoribosylaminopyrimidine deaminase/5-amino-6-(5-phosphoribosylamino)uracil reductase RibD [Porticoccaceae bacterium]|nr:bifunctional diaminohydroxyphosphoribosylaminopyrimidine deaminase/5-amino-6-(5-phosphoribosylamino)uracil reductase RibD [Porticoccaceae bacterium]